MIDPCDQIYCGHAAEVLSGFPDGSVDLVVTSPPYWTAVSYGAPPHASYEGYLADVSSVFEQCARVMRPNAKLCVNAPLMPVPQSVLRQDTRHLKNIAADLDARVLLGTPLLRYGLFVWQKQTSKLMFGSYPHPGNIIENNTVEFISVYVNPGRPPKFSPEAKTLDKFTRDEWLDLTQQVWSMHPETSRRRGGHPAPFPPKLPGRLIRLYTYRGEVVLDPFAGTGTTCAVARAMGRRYVGVDINPTYAELCRARVAEGAAPPELMVGRPRYPSAGEVAEAGTGGRAAGAKHRRSNYGRGAASD